MPNILLVSVQMLRKNPAKEIISCVAKIIPTNLRKSVKLLYITNINMFSTERVYRKIAE